MAQSSQAPNHLLAHLGADELAALLPHLKPVELSQETVFFESGDAIRTVYFPHNALISLVVDLAAGGMIEAAMIGRDGVAGGSAAFGSKISLNRAVVQVAGSASVLDVNVFCDFADRNAVFRARLARHEQFVLAQAQQSAACNAARMLEARLSRWLLRCRDLLLSDDIPLTHEFLGEMLGVQRTSVSIVANTLQRAGLIRYRRGQLDAGHQSEFQARGAAREGNPGSDKDPEARERELSRPCSARDRGTAPAWNRRAVRFPAI